ncbi:MAG: hypothetical protein IKA62_08790 [Clostridia bacterium]|nr:hypothetical protein [Clostridia bacterium]
MPLFNFVALIFSAVNPDDTTHTEFINEKFFYDTTSGTATLTATLPTATLANASDDWQILMGSHATISISDIRVSFELTK